jgi:hypothetical protein
LSMQTVQCPRVGGCVAIKCNAQLSIMLN